MRHRVGLIVGKNDVHDNVLTFVNYEKLVTEEASAG